MVSDANESTRTAESDSKQKLEDSAAAWLFRGLMLGVMVAGMANALSFFFRSRGWGSLLGDREPHDEAIGFPLMVWEEGAGYGAHPLKMFAFAIDITSAIVLGLAIGLVAIWQRPALNQIMDRFRSQSSGNDVRLQFSVRGLMITTVLAALAAAAVRSLTPRVEVLAAIYAFGPAGLILFAYLPRRLRWQQRVAILTPSAIVLIVVAITLGSVLSVEFDKVLMGIFICWTPQAAIGAIALTSYLLAKEYRAIKTA